MGIEIEVYTPKEVAEMMDCSEGKAYNMIRSANLKRLKEKNLDKEAIRWGRIPKDYFDEIHGIKKSWIKYKRRVWFKRSPSFLKGGF